MKAVRQTRAANVLASRLVRLSTSVQNSDFNIIAGLYDGARIHRRWP